MPDRLDAALDADPIVGVRMRRLRIGRSIQCAAQRFLIGQWLMRHIRWGRGGDDVQLTARGIGAETR